MSERTLSNLHMPEEIVIDILSRLPVKSLLQFRSVSKQWRSVIDNGQFIKSHLSRSLLSSTNLKLLLPTSPLRCVNYNALSDMIDASMEVDCPFVSENAQIRIVGNCNGLVCFLVDSRDLIVYNPSTRHSKTLLTHPQIYGSSLLGINVPFAFGFGCSLSSPLDFKMVVFSRLGRHCQIYSVRNNSFWRTQNMIHSFDLLEQVSTFLNGSCHWVSQRSGGETFIVSFDFSKEVFKEMCLPSHINRLRYTTNKLRGIKGDLCALCDNPTYAHVDVWVMKEYGVEGSWMKFFSVPRVMGPRRISFIVPLSFTKEGEVLLEINLKNLVAYDTKKKAFRNVMVHGGPSGSGTGVTVLYVESLVSPNGVE